MLPPERFAEQSLRLFELKLTGLRLGGRLLREAVTLREGLAESV